MSDAVLVTGGAGFIGGHVVRRVAEAGRRVVSVDNRPPGPEMAWWLAPVADRVTPVVASVDDWPALVDVFRRHTFRGVVHLAAVNNAVLLQRRPDIAVNVNFLGSYRALELARQFDAGRFVYFSSIGVLPSLKYEPVDADHPVLRAAEGPGSGFYGAAKAAGEAFCFAYRQCFGLDVVILRPSAVYGFGMQWPLFVKPMVENGVRGLPTRFEHGAEFPRDYTHVKDVADLALLALEAPADRLTERVFYAATGRPLVTAGEAARLVGEILPEAEIEVGTGLSEDDLIEIRYRGVLAIDNARRLLGYSPRFADLRDGLADYVADYRRYVGSGG